MFRACAAFGLYGSRGLWQGRKQQMDKACNLLLYQELTSSGWGHLCSDVHIPVLCQS
jgi:hypothetical protein